MAVYEITSPTGEVYEITAPDDASESDVLAYAQKNFQTVEQADLYTNDPTEGMSWGDKFLAGMGKGFADIGRGFGQLTGLTSQEEIDAARARDAALMDTGAGITGNIAGNIAAFAPAAFIPGANTVAGASLVGGAMGAAQPVATGESRLTNTGLGTLGGAGGHVLGNVAGKTITNRLQALKGQQNANLLKDQFLNQAKEAGYKVPASYQRAGVLPRMAEGLSGKYKTNQLAGIRNQEVTDRLARQAIGLADDAPLTAEAAQAVRTQAFNQAYTPVRNAGRVVTDADYLKALDDAVSAQAGAAKSFPGMKGAVDIEEMLQPLKVGEFDSADAIDMIQILRDETSKAYRTGDKGLGKALRKASNAIEDQLERHLQGMGKQGDEILTNFREGRKLMAKAHSVEDAIVDGNIDAMKIAGEWKKGKPLSGELQKIGRFGESYPDVARIPKSGNANPFTVVDFGYGGAAGMAIDPTLMALPLARVGARQALLSSPVQKAIGPSYSAPMTQVANQALNNPAGQELLRLLGPAALIGAGQQ